MSVEGQRIAVLPRLGALGFAVLCAWLGALALAAPSALAERLYDSQMTGPPFSNPDAIAVTGSDGIWVDELGNNGNISEYDAYPSQTLEGSQSGGGHYGGSVQSIALDNSTGYLYAADSGPVVVDVFDATGAFKETWQTESSCGTDSVAVDNSGGETQGRVYVARRCSGPQQLQALKGEDEESPFSGSASYINGNKITGTPSGSISEIDNVATDLEGDFYLVDKGNGRVDEFAKSGLFLREFTGAGAPQPFSGELTGVAVDPLTGNVLIVDNGNHVVDEFSSGGAYLEQLTGANGQSFGNLPGGIAVTSGGFLYVADSGHNVVDIFTPNFKVPTVTYGQIEHPTQASGTLTASVDPNEGGEVLSCHFEYGTNTSYGLGSLPCNPAAPFSATQSVSADVSGLTAETSYHYRVVAGNSKGTKKGADQTFTPHWVAGLHTDAPTDVEHTSATLNASFVGNGEDTRYYFEWGPTGAYGNKTAEPAADAGSPSGPGRTPLSFHLTGLSPETTYHYRIVASNGLGTSRDIDQHFTTPTAVASVETEPASEPSAGSLTLNGSWVGNGEDTHYYFEWGLTEAYGNRTAALPGTDGGSASGPQTRSVELESLEPDIAYHFRMVASNSAGTTYGADKSLTTLASFVFSKDLGSVGSGAGQLKAPGGVGVDESTGDVYVADTGNHRVVEFDRSGGFVRAWGWGVSDGASSSEVCSSTCQAGVSGAGAGQFESPAFVSVDNSSGVSAGDVYVGDPGDGMVQKFSPEGALVTSWGASGALSFAGIGELKGLAVDPHGDLFVHPDGTSWFKYAAAGSIAATLDPNFSDPGSSRGIAVDALGALYQARDGTVEYRVSTIYPGEAIPGEHPGPDDSVYVLDNGAGGAITGLALNAIRNEIFIDHGNTIHQFTAPGNCTSQFCSPNQTLGEGHLVAAEGLALDQSQGALYAADAGGNDVAVFTRLPTPDVVTGKVENVGAESGLLTGHVDPAGAGNITECFFQYGTIVPSGFNSTTAWLGTVPCSQATPVTSPEDVTAELGGLQPFSTYVYRLVAIGANSDRLFSHGEERSFTPGPALKPTVGGTTFSDVTPTTAALSAQINPSLAATIYRFEYGSNTSYGARTLPSESIGEDDSEHAVGGEISGLTPGSTYHFRVVATNFNGTTTGPDQTFSTPNVPSVAETAVSNVGETAATLSASVRPEFSPTTYHFEYGLTGSYGSRTTESQAIGADNVAHAAVTTLGGLQSGTTYHYRIVATNGVGATAGPDLVFTTVAAPKKGEEEPAACGKGLIRKKGRCVKRKPKHHRVKPSHHGKAGHAHG